MGKIRGTHSSPGVYTQITDLQYSAKSMGITTLGLVGETKKGPAFEPIAISDWTQFQEYFGGTSPEKFPESQMPKYELPYVAKSYLSASDQLYVCRVLGLSGYNAGKAFVLYGTKGEEQEKYVLGVLRSRGEYVKYGGVEANCNNSEAENNYDTLTYYCDNVVIKHYEDKTFSSICNNLTSTTSTESTEAKEVNVSPGNYGKFILECETEDGVKETYVVSLNPGDKEYIYNVLGSDPLNGSAMIYVEALYDIELQRLIDEQKVKTIGVEPVDSAAMNVKTSPVRDFLKVRKADLNRKMLGQTFLYGEEKCPFADDKEASGYTEGTVYKVVKDNGAYDYREVTNLSGKTDVVEVLSMDAFYCMLEGKISPFKNIGNYREQFRHAMTPWFVSELKGNGANIELKKLFRLHTITDGNYANEEIKVTIANVRPDEGTFDLLIRDYHDSDGNQVILEAYRGINLIPGNPKYIGLKVGTLNGDYELKSKYVMVEIAENETIETCVPCGFLGYPVTNFGEYTNPSFVYNTIYDDNIKANRQCFGLSDLKGVDVDMLYYKGKDAYTESYDEKGYTKGFHLDSTITAMAGDGDNKVTITLDGVEIGHGFETVSVNSVTNEGLIPVIGSESVMEGTIYEDVKARKFTCYPYGGFDGWDIYRGSRTNTDEYRTNKYKGSISNDYGKTFSKIHNGDNLNLPSNAITSDYYAYLAGYNQFSNTEKYVINLFATPGIDYVNNRLLTDDVLDIIHNRQDTFYVMTTPDKPFGAGESVDEMYTASDVVSNLEDSAIDTYYASTYYPWVRYYDATNSMYISLPVTKDVLRNMADVDNKKYPWYAPAGIERGSVECARARIFTKIEDEDTTTDGRINPVKTFSADGVKIWGNKTLYSLDTPMNRINTVRLVLYMRKLINEASRVLLFEPNDVTLKQQFESIINPILSQIKTDRGITDYRLKVNQTPEMMDAHEIQCDLWIKPTPTLEYIEINFVVTPQGVEFED